MKDCLIVGGGLIGLLTAREFAQAGVQVTVIERGELGRESSWAGGGILSPLYPWTAHPAVTALVHASQGVYPPLAQALAQASGIDPEWTRSGMLILDEEEQARADGWAQRHGVRLERLDAAGARRIEPRLAAWQRGALWLPDIAQVRNPRLLAALRADLVRRGVQLLEHTPCTGVLVRDGRVQAVQTGAGVLAASAVIVAAGAWASALLQPVTAAVEVAPVRGQMLLLRADAGWLTRIVLHQDRYLIPRRDGRILVGSTVEHGGFDKATTEQAHAELRQAAAALIPELARVPLERHWAGLRPGSRQGIPYIGAVPGALGLFVNVGHYRNGVAMGPAAARLLADIVLSRAPIVAPQAYEVAAPREESGGAAVN